VGDIVAASPQHQRDCEQAFYAGVWVAMGLTGRANRMSNMLAKEVVNTMMAECNQKLQPKKLARVTATICGEKI
jgi:hypothetical protein